MNNKVLSYFCFGKLPGEAHPIYDHLVKPHNTRGPLPMDIIDLAGILMLIINDNGYLSFGSASIWHVCKRF